MKKVGKYFFLFRNVLPSVWLIEAKRIQKRKLFGLQS